eukprot:6485563-Amphidinium_carterae.1
MYLPPCSQLRQPPSWPNSDRHMTDDQFAAYSTASQPLFINTWLLSLLVQLRKGRTPCAGRSSSTTL